MEFKSFFYRYLCEWIPAFEGIPILSIVDLINKLLRTAIVT